jgi:hypothetical protein
MGRDVAVQRAPPPPSQISQPVHADRRCSFATEAGDPLSPTRTSHEKYLHSPVPVELRADGESPGAPEVLADNPVQLIVEETPVEAPDIGFVCGRERLREGRHDRRGSVLFTASNLRDGFAQSGTVTAVVPGGKIRARFARENSFRTKACRLYWTENPPHCIS